MSKKSGIILKGALVLLLMAISCPLGAEAVDLKFIKSYDSINTVNSQTTRMPMGMILVNNTAKLAKETGTACTGGIMAFYVYTPSPAERAGLRNFDVITSFNGKRVNDTKELESLIKESPRNEYHFRICRDGAPLNVNVTVRSVSTQVAQEFINEVGRGFQASRNRIIEEARQRRERIATANSGGLTRQNQGGSNNDPVSSNKVFLNRGYFAMVNGNVQEWNFSPNGTFTHVTVVPGFGRHFQRGYYMISNGSLEISTNESITAGAGAAVHGQLAFQNNKKNVQTMRIQLIGPGGKNGMVLNGIRYEVKTSNW